MGFVNEIITDEDRKKYDLDTVESAPVMRMWAPERQWTIDHEREIYLRMVNLGRGERSHKSTWHFHWGNELMQVCLEMVDAGGVRGGHGWSHYRLVECFTKGFFIPDSLISHREQIIADLREAISTYAGGGIYPTRTSSETTLTI